MSAGTSRGWRHPGVVASPLFAIPALLELWFVHAFGVNVPIEDTWNGTLPIARAFSRGHLPWVLLYAPHNGNRTFFPGLVLGLLESHTAGDDKVDMYVSTLLLILSLLALLRLVWRTNRPHPLLLVPLGFILFDFVQVGNLLWAFQLTWILVIPCLLVMLLALDHRQRPLAFLVAVIAAGIATFSALQGLLFWPVGVLFGWLSGWGKRWLALWSALGVVAAVVYFWDLQFANASSGLGYDRAHPLVAAEYFLSLVGAPAATSHAELAGAGFLASLVVLALLLWRARVPLRQLRTPVALIAMALMFDVLVTLGRTGIGPATASRYTTFDLLLLTGIYLAALQLWPPRREGESAGRSLRSGWRRLGGAVCVLVVVATLVVVARGMDEGLRVGRATRVSRLQDATVLREFRSEPLGALQSSLYSPSGEYVREWAQWLQAQRWSVFAGQRA